MFGGKSAYPSKHVLDVWRFHVCKPAVVGLIAEMGFCCDFFLHQFVISGSAPEFHIECFYAGFGSVVRNTVLVAKFA